MQPEINKNKFLLIIRERKEIGDYFKFTWYKNKHPGIKMIKNQDKLVKKFY